MSEVDLSQFVLIPTEEAVATTQEMIAGILNEQRQTTINMIDLFGAIAGTYNNLPEDTLQRTGAILGTIAIFLTGNVIKEWLLAEIPKQILKQHIAEYEAGYFDLQ